MKDITAPIEKALLKKELTSERFLRHTTYSNNELYVVNYHNAPNVMQEIGRLREVTFRAAGGGTGKELDIDAFDTAETPYQQLIVWDPEREEILGGYRFQVCKSPDCKKNIATGKLFNLSEKFENDYLPYMIELGRSFIQPNFQSTAANTGRKSLYTLDNLWDGLGALVIEYPHARYFFGKVTMYPHFNREARDMILFFLQKYFADKDGLVIPKHPIHPETDKQVLEDLFSGKDFKENAKILSQQVRKREENVPPLINAYMNLSDSMRVFGTAINESFGHVEETGIMLTIKDIHPAKRERYFDSYLREKEENNK
jgi:hypothetical protein